MQAIVAQALDEVRGALSKTWCACVTSLRERADDFAALLAGFSTDYFAATPARRNSCRCANCTMPAMRLED